MRLENSQTCHIGLNCLVTEHFPLVLRGNVQCFWNDFEQGIPRTVLFDQKTGSNLLQWPVEEIEKLRLNMNNFDRVQVKAGSVVPLDVGTATQVCILYAVLKFISPFVGNYFLAEILIGMNVTVGHRRRV